MFSLTPRLTELGPWWIVIALVSLDVTAMVRALIRGHGVASTLAWILAIVAFPGVGATAYLFLANPSIRRAIRRKTAALGRPLAQALSDVLSGNGERQLARLIGRLTNLRASANNQIDLLVEDEEAFGQIEADLASAKETIWAEYYIVKKDETGRRFLEALRARAQAGVKVRLLYDGLGSLGLDGACLKAIRAAGGKVEPFLPLNPLRRRWAVHLRNHRKLIIVDGQVVFTGGMNVGDEYSGRSRRQGNQHFRDTHLRIQGPAVRDFAVVFAEDWKFATDEVLRLPERQSGGRGQAVVCPLPSGPDQIHNASAHTFFAGIMAARQHCFITTPYFIPDEPTIRALITSAKSGVDVRVLLPARNDLRIVGLAARSFYRQLVHGGVRVFEYQPSMLHSKSMVVDERWGIVGSANVDMRSFRLNFEVGAVFFDPALTQEMSRRFLADLAASREITVGSLRRLGLGGRVLQGIARLLAPLL